MVKPQDGGPGRMITAAVIQTRAAAIAMLYGSGSNRSPDLCKPGQRQLRHVACSASSSMPASICPPDQPLVATSMPSAVMWKDPHPPFRFGSPSLGATWKPVAVVSRQSGCDVPDRDGTSCGFPSQLMVQVRMWHFLVNFFAQRWEPSSQTGPEQLMTALCFY